VTGIQKANFLNSNQKEKKTSEGVTETEHRIKTPCAVFIIKFTVAATEALKRRKSAPEEEKKAPLQKEAKQGGSNRSGELRLFDDDLSRGADFSIAASLGFSTVTFCIFERFALPPCRNELKIRKWRWSTRSWMSTYCD